MQQLFIVGLSLLGLVQSTLAQGTFGTIHFNNRITTFGLDAPVSIASSPFGPGLFGPGPAYSAGLYHEGVLIPGSVTPFRDGSENPIWAKYIVPITVPVPGTVPGQQNFVVEMRAWLTAAGSFENAGPMLRGSSGQLVIAMLGGDIDPTRPNHLPPSFTGFFVFPEPSTLSLALAGTALFLGWRKVRGVS